MKLITNIIKRMKKTTKIITAAVIILVIAVAAGYSMMAPVAIPLTKVEQVTAELSFTEQGTVVAGEVVSVLPLAQGSVLSVGVSEGQTVNKGDTLCIIDKAPLALKITQLESGIKSYEAQISNLASERQRAADELQASKNRLYGELRALESQELNSGVTKEEQARVQSLLIEQSRNDLKRATDELKSIEILYSAGAVSKSEYNDAVTAVAKCADELESNEIQLNLIAAGAYGSEYYSGMKASINAQIAGIDRSLSNDYTIAMAEYYGALIAADNVSIKQLKQDIENCQVKSPISGVVTELYVKNTNYVSGASPVAVITASEGGEVETYISTKEVGGVHEGDVVGLTLKRRGGDIAFSGTVEYVSAAAEARLSALGVEDSGVKVRISPHFDELDGIELGSGYELDVKFYVYNEQNKLTAPKTAIFKDNGRDMIFVVKNGKANAVEVSTGMELRTEVVIESGLNPGDMIVTDVNDKNIKEGARVKNV